MPAWRVLWTRFNKSFPGDNTARYSQKARVHAYTRYNQHGQVGHVVKMWGVTLFFSISLKGESEELRAPFSRLLGSDFMSASDPSHWSFCSSDDIRVIPPRTFFTGPSA